MSTLKEAITKYRRGSNPNLEAFDLLREMFDLMEERAKQQKREIQDLFEEMARQIKKTKEELKEYLDTRIENIEQTEPQTAAFFDKTVKRAVTALVQLEKGEKGDDGISPDSNEIADIVMTKIRIPEDGRDGRDGMDGKDGKDGEKGEKSDSNPDTPKQIAEKINTLEEVIEQHTIKGLNMFMQSVQNAVREARKPVARGGGMGNPQHETFNLTTGSASIITAFPIAVSGNAVMGARYQGQTLNMIEHYTVGSDNRTITFNSELRNQFIEGGKFAITYIRG